MLMPSSNNDLFQSDKCARQQLAPDANVSRYISAPHRWKIRTPTAHLDEDLPMRLLAALYYPNPGMVFAHYAHIGMVNITMFHSSTDDNIARSLPLTFTGFHLTLQHS